jgi:predicted RNA-binding protein YlqC (UPF0109 family)
MAKDFWKTFSLSVLCQETLMAIAKEMLGKVIGKQGRTAQSIRTILSAAAGNTRERYMLEIVE